MLAMDRQARQATHTTPSVATARGLTCLAASVDVGRQQLQGVERAHGLAQRRSKQRPPAPARWARQGAARRKPGQGGQGGGGAGAAAAAAGVGAGRDGYTPGYTGSIKTRKGAAPPSVGRGAQAHGQARPGQARNPEACKHCAGRGMAWRGTPTTGSRRPCCPARRGTPSSLGRAQSPRRRSAEPLRKAGTQSAGGRGGGGGGRGSGRWGRDAAKEGSGCCERRRGGGAGACSTAGLQVAPLPQQWWRT